MVGHGESSLRRRSAEPEPVYRDNIQLKDASINISEASDSKRETDHDLPVYDDGECEDVWGDSSQDKRDMLRMGKKQVRTNIADFGRCWFESNMMLQEFKRNFNLVSAIAFVSVYMATWEFVLVSLSVGFSNGGYAGLFWCFITTVLCYATIVASLAEMESMAPTAGGTASPTIHVEP